MENTNPSITNINSSWKPVSPRQAEEGHSEWLKKLDTDNPLETTSLQAVV